MKDLKHLIEFENLLQEANNELVQQAKADGKIALGYTCYHIPEVLLNLPGCFSTRLRAPRTGSLDIATYYMSSYLCGYSKALVERGIEGGYNYLDALIGSESCSEMNRAYEHFELLNLVNNPKFFVSIADVPFKIMPHTVKHFKQQLQIKLLDKIHDVYGIDISDDAMRKAVEEHNEVCRLITEIGEYRKEDNPRITGYEFHVINLVSYVCPKYLIIDKLTDDGDVLEQIILHYMHTSQCPRYMSHDKVVGRKEYVRQLVNDYHADGVIYEQLKFCEYWGYERALASHIVSNDYGIPTVTVDRQYTANASGQLRTRIQAFVESLEIKKIQKAQKAREAAVND